MRWFYYYLFIYLPVDCVYQNAPSARIRSSDSVQSWYSVDTMKIQIKRYCKFLIKSVTLSSNCQLIHVHARTTGKLYSITLNFRINTCNTSLNIFLSYMCVIMYYQDFKERQFFCQQSFSCFLPILSPKISSWNILEPCDCHYWLWLGIRIQSGSALSGTWSNCNCRCIANGLSWG